MPSIEPHDNSGDTSWGRLPDPDPSQAASEASRNRQNLEMLAAETGGTLAGAKRVPALLSRQRNATYVLAYRIAPQVQAAGSHSIRVSIPHFDATAEISDAYGDPPACGP
jgi:hypothetical protein